MSESKVCCVICAVLCALDAIAKKTPWPFDDMLASWIHTQEKWICDRVIDILKGMGIDIIDDGVIFAYDSSTMKENADKVLAEAGTPPGVR